MIQQSAAIGENGFHHWTEEQITEHQSQRRPFFSQMGHASLPVRNLDEAKRFYTEVLGGRLVLSLPTFTEVVVAGMIFGFSEMSGTPQDSNDEYPHIAFFIDQEQFIPMKQWLEKHGVRTHDMWTRNGREALMYFKDPSGNLFEIYCAKYDGADKLPVGGPLGGDGIVALSSLNYDWKG